MKFILVPDSYKGTLSSEQVCAIMKKAITDNIKGSEVVSFPVADGGEGSVDCFIGACGGKKIPVRVKGPFFDAVDTYYGIFKSSDGVDTAVIETASCAGLPLAERSRHGKDPLKSTTYGVGEQIKDAVKRGCKRVIIGLGGSCTNDGGCGAAAACGAKFTDKNGKEFIPVGETLENISYIELDEIKHTLHGTEIIAMCDVENVFSGPSGAAYTFARQKGANDSQIKLLDNNLAELSKRIEKQFGIDLNKQKGAGAAGGLGGGMCAFFSAEMRSGIDTVLDTVGFDEALKGAFAVFTGEGKTDSQSIRGKVISGVAKRAKRAGVPVIVVSGDVDGDMSEAYALGVSAVFSTNRVAKPFYEIKPYCADNLAFTMDNISKTLAMGMKQ